jgi:hypothetical protein
MFIFVLAWSVLVVLLIVGTTWLQGYIYSEPVAGIFWRGPAAASLLILVMAFWCFLDSRAPAGRFRTLFTFNANDETEFKELWGLKDGKRVHYKAEKNAAGRNEYRDDNKRPMPSRLEAIIVKEDGEEVKFEPERDAQGKFKNTPGQSLRYVDPQGRVMTDDAIGQLSLFRWGRFLANVVLNLFFLLAWFACLWLLLEFQWAHALGLAAVIWLVMILLVMPPLLDRTEALAGQGSAPSTGEAHAGLGTAVLASASGGTRWPGNPESPGAWPAAGSKWLPLWGHVFDVPAGT